ncbi:two-component regulator propeller domain-containing protein [Mucilaginibacter sp. FT3.2]|uniref:two-component regulator propeller domain-containing protein n=1 Tax=Mucilaginibacter sp. FT3.2 TaxID=2723090 RepID=UPI001817A9F4|nr:two-component regulator propeller domain-containing protein [Mucilaginibacter sp. FT3.2]MBB6233170.1 ligand-binding sensor domain-containing protein [Mucilaginibacter sp. FT3.2]
MPYQIKDVKKIQTPQKLLFFLKFLKIKYLPVYTLFLMLVCQTSCGQKQTEPHKDNINYNIKDTITSYGPHTMVRNMKRGRNGTILIAASWGGIFRYDGKLFTNLTSKIGSRRFWDALEDRRGNLWFASTDSGVYNYNGETFKHFTTREGLLNNLVMSIYEDKAGVIWFGTGGGSLYVLNGVYKNILVRNLSRP